MNKILHPSLPKKGDLKITKSHRGITLTATATKVYNVLLLNNIQSEVEKSLMKNQAFGEIDIQFQILTICQAVEGVHAKNLEATLLWVDFQIHLLKPNSCCPAWSKQPEALASWGMYIKQS